MGRLIHMIADKVIEIDELKLLFREPYKINDKITLYQPTVGEVIEFGEKEYYGTVHMLSCIPSDMKSQLWDMQIDWEEMPDFDLFVMLSRQLTKDQTKLIFGDLDLSTMELQQSSLNGEIQLVNNNGVVIDRLIYMKIVEYIRKLHSIVPKVEKAGNKSTKKILIELDRQRIAKASKESYKSQLKDLISGMMRYPGFKYKMSELKECGLYEFMDTVQGAQIYVSSTALLSGSYSGMIDTSKVPKEQFNWMRSLSSSKSNIES